MSIFWIKLTAVHTCHSAIHRQALSAHLVLFICHQEAVLIKTTTQVHDLVLILLAACQPLPAPGGHGCTGFPRICAKHRLQNA